MSVKSFFKAFTNLLLQNVQEEQLLHHFKIQFLFLVQDRALLRRDCSNPGTVSRSRVRLSRQPGGYGGAGGGREGKLCTCTADPVKNIQEKSLPQTITQIVLECWGN